MATDKAKKSTPAKRTSTKGKAEARQQEAEAAATPDVADPITTGNPSAPSTSAAGPADGIGGYNVPVSERPDADSEATNNNAS